MLPEQQIVIRLVVAAVLGSLSMGQPVFLCH
jgi:hypothetical protein